MKKILILQEVISRPVLNQESFQRRESQRIIELFKKYGLFLIGKNMYPNIYSCCTTGNNTEAQTVVRITILSTLSH